MAFAQYYFWRSGTQPLQRSLAGLCRTLLHDLLKQYPELMPTALPCAWKAFISTPWQAQPSFDITQDEITKGLETLITNLGAEQYQDRCFCFFVDGLDEYEIKGRQDYAWMASLLNKWAASSDSIKLCVSSRDENAFRNAFSEEQRLHLHELTYMDMEAVVREDLKQVSGSAGFDHLVHDILFAAQGIFQWVTVVIGYLRRCIEDGLDDPEELILRVKRLPVDINILYKHILESLQEKRRAYRTLAMISKAIELNLPPISVAAYTFFDAHEDDNGRAMSKPLKREVPSDCAHYIERGKKRLRGCTGGLLETTPSKRGTNSDPNHHCAREVIQFVHRSVPDFLAEKEVQIEMAKHLEGFDMLDMISHMFLADFNIYLARRNTRSQKIDFAPILTILLPLRQQASLDRSPFAFLETLDSLFQSFDGGARLDGLPSHPFNIEMLLKCSYTFKSIISRYLASCSPELTRLAQYRPADLFMVRPIYYTLWKGDSKYALWKVKTDLGVTDNFSKVALLAYILFDRLSESPFGSALSDEKSDFALLDLLLTRGLLEKKTHLARRLSVPVDSSVSIQSLLSSLAAGKKPDGITTSMTVWQHFLHEEWVIQHQRPLSSDRDASFAKTVAWFLRNGADPRLSVKSSYLDKTGFNESGKDYRSSFLAHPTTRLCGV